MYSIRSDELSGQSGEGDLTHHIIESRRSELGHHCLGESIVRCLEESEYDIICPV